MDKYQIWEKQKDTIAHKEYLKISDTNLLGHIHIANYEVIQSELSKFNSPEIVFHYSLNRNELKKQHINISRHFLNYISSALSFRDSTRNLHKINVLNIDVITNKSREIINEEFLKKSNHKINGRFKKHPNPSKNDLPINIIIYAPPEKNKHTRICI